jgi:DNA-binding CsgD family transcriptional regulator
LTLPKVLLAINTPASRQQAAVALARLHAFVTEIHNTRFTIEVLAMQALLHHADGNEPAALQALEQAVALARPGGFVRVFVDLGPALVGPLEQLAVRGIAPGYVEQILHAFRAGAAAYCSKDIHAGKLLDVIRQVSRGFFVVHDQVYDAAGLEDWLSHGVESQRRPHLEGEQEAFAPLSPREMEILQFVTRGLSNKEIAAKLGISHQTVKNHMTAILHKLDVEDRTQAAVYALRHGWVRLQDTRK